KRKDGTEFISHATISATRNENGEITDYISVQHDITEQRQAEEALQQQHNLLRTLIDNIPDSIYVKDIEGRFLVVNNEMARRVGAKTPDELIGKTNYDFYPKAEADKYYADDQKLIGSGRSVINRENSTLIPATGEQICNLKTKIPLKDASGKVVSIVGIGRDITERKQAAEALRKAYDELEQRVKERTAELAQANEQLRRDIVERQQLEQRVQQHQMEVAHYSRLSTVGEMTSGLAHEINQPLCAIANYARGALQMMKSGTYDSDELLDVMKEIGTQAERSGKIIHRLEKLVRKQEVYRCSIDINDVINEAIGFMEAEAHRSKVTIRQIVASEKIPAILADSIQIEQVLLNILHNSFEAMYDTNDGERQATIEVLIDNGSMIQVSISDNGEGLAVEDVDKVFDAFFTTKSNGLGMGLAISRTIIEAHGGRIWAERNETGGATFRFILPVEGAEV
ncbi:MAG: PAS domain S-box protein, partial [Planctomycetes bacterium]|nr:PAS domain S-box protein [Planctomycetota bacterium]